MTIAAGKTPYHTYFPGSAMSPEAIPFEYLDGADISVSVVDGATLIEGVDYQLGGDGRTGTGTITALIDAGSDEWELWSDTPTQQQIDLAESRKVPLPQYERELDRAAIRTRENAFNIDRAPKVPRGESIANLPALAQRKGSLLGAAAAIAYAAYDVDGNPTVDTPDNFATPAAAEADRASEKADQSQSARDAAIAYLNPYADQAVGEAATSEGEPFSFIDGNDQVALAVRTAGGSTLLPSYFDAGKVAGAGKTIATRTALKALTSAADKARPLQLTESGREGLFVWDSSDLSTEVALDTQEGVYVAPDSDATGASGAWVRQFSSDLKIQWFGAVGDGSTNDRTAIEAGIAFASSYRFPLRFAGKTYAVTGASGIAIPSNTRIYGVEGETVIAFTGTLSDTRFIQINSDPAKCPTLTEAAASYSGYDYAALNDQGAGLSYVTCVTAADAGDYDAGDFVFVACGIDPIDANDTLWRYQQVFKVTGSDAGTGKVWLDGVVTVAVSADGFADSAGANLAAAWANSTSYSSGDYALSNNAGSGSGTAVWRATSAGTSSGTGPANDTGVSWVKVTTEQEGLEGTRDTRPIIFKVPAEDAVENVYIQGIRIANRSAQLAVKAFEVKSALNVTLTDTEIDRGDIQIGYAANEATRRMKVIRGKFTVSQSATGGQRGRAFSAYGAKEVLFDQCDFQCGLNGYQGGFIEGFADVTISNSVITSGYYSSGAATSKFVQSGPGSIALLNNKILGFGTPLRLQVDLTGFPTGTTLGRNMAKGNLFQMAAQNFRGGNNDRIIQFWPGNSFEILSNSGDVEASIDLSDAEIVMASATFTPVNSGAGVITDFSVVGPRGDMYPAYGPAVFLGCQVYWASAPASQTFNARPEALEADGGARLLGASTSTNNQVEVSDTAPFNEKFDFDGTTIRTIGRNERARFKYFSSSGAASGTITVNIVLLKQREKA